MSDYPKFYREGIIRSRKEHKCCECNGVILNRQDYHYFVGLWDDFDTWKTCFHCNELREEINDNLDGEDRLCFGELGQHICDTSDMDHVERFLDIHLMRGKVVPDWLLKRFSQNKQAVITISDLLKKN